MATRAENWNWTEEDERRFDEFIRVDARLERKEWEEAHHGEPMY